MSTQTKMTPEMREYLDSMRKESPNTEIFQYPDAGVTVAIRPVGNGFADIGVAYKAPDETKFRKNVGEYLARQRVEYGEYTRVKLAKIDYQDFAEIIADMGV